MADDPQAVQRNLLKDLIKEALAEVMADANPAPSKTDPPKPSILDTLFGS